MFSCFSNHGGEVRAGGSSSGGFEWSWPRVRWTNGLVCPAESLARRCGAQHPAARRVLVEMKHRAPSPAIPAHTSPGPVGAGGRKGFPTDTVTDFCCRTHFLVVKIERELISSSPSTSAFAFERSSAQLENAVGGRVHLDVGPAAFTLLGWKERPAKRRMKLI